MNPVIFPEMTKTLGAPDGHVPNEEIGEITGLPVHATGIQCISCWQMTWRERFSALIFGRVWLGVFSGQTQPPVYVTATRRYFIKPVKATITGSPRGKLLYSREQIGDFIEQFRKQLHKPAKAPKDDTA